MNVDETPARRLLAARLALLTMGFTATAAQVVVIRELLVAFHGNELFLGVIFANWLLLEAAGNCWVRRRADRAALPAQSFALLQILAGFGCLASILCIRSFKHLLGITSGEVLGVHAAALVALGALAPLAVTAGALFPFGCRSLSLVGKRQESAARAYIYEAAGACVAGLALVLVLIRWLNPIELAGVIVLSSLGAALLLLVALPSSRPWRIGAVALLGLSAIFFAAGGARRLHEASARLLWHDQALVQTRNSVYANIAVVGDKTQYTFFANGAPYATTPAPAAPLEELAHVPMLFHARPEQVLVIGGGAGGLLAELLKHPTVRRIDYAEPDPRVLEAFRRFPTALTEHELNHEKVRTHLVEGRRFLRTSPARHDLIVIHLPIPATLQLNRYYTLEFFRLARQRLAPGGLVAVKLPGSETVLSPELKALNQTLHATLRAAFPHVRVVAGDQNLFVASADPAIEAVGPDTLVGRLHERAVVAGLITGPYLRYRTDPQRFGAFERDITASAHKPPNRDTHPRGVLEAMLFLNSVASPLMVGVLAAADRLRLAHWLAALAALTLASLWLQRRCRPQLFLGYAIASTGFTSMLLNLLLIFALQVHYGHVYHYIGLLSALFMLGLAFGADFARRHVGTPLWVVECAIALFVGLLYLFTRFAGAPPLAQFVIGALMWTAGFLTGAEYPLAVRRADAACRALSATAGHFYALDLLGAFLGAMLAAVVLVPTLGVAGALLVALTLKAGSLLLVCAARLTRADAQQV